MAVVNSSRFNFAEVVQKMLQDYGYEVMEEVYEGLNEASKKAVKKMRQEAAAAIPGTYSNTGKYAKGWTRTIERKRLSVYATIHGKERHTYALAHLLEKSHAKRGGGRSNAFPHIEKVNEWAQDEAYNCIVSKLEQRL